MIHLRNMILAISFLCIFSAVIAFSIEENFLMKSDRGLKMMNIELLLSIKKYLDVRGTPNVLSVD